MKPALNVNLSVGSPVGVGAGVGGVADVFTRWSMQNATLTITNPTDQTWVYTVILLSSAFIAGAPFFFEQSLGPGESASKTITLTISGGAGVADVYVTATEVSTGTVLYDGAYIDTITIVEPVPLLNVSIVWDDSTKVFNQFTTQWATLTIHNPTDQEWTYSVFLLSSAFILGLPPFWQQPLAPGATATARVGPLMTGAPGVHDVAVTVEVEGVLPPTIIDHEVIDTITIVAPIPALDVDLGWGSGPPTAASVTWSFLSDGNWDQILPDTFTGVVVLNDLVNVPPQIQTVYDLELGISWDAERGIGNLQNLVAGTVYTVVVTGPCDWVIPL